MLAMAWSLKNLDSQGSLDRYYRWLECLAIVLLLSYASWKAYGLYQIQHSVIVAKNQPGLSRFTPVEPNPKPYKTLASENFLFGTSFAKKPTIKSSKPAPLTQLNVKLLAIFHQGDQSMAVIQEGREKSSILSVGDLVRHGVTVAAINRSSITINRQGNLEKMIFASFDPGSPILTHVPSN